jgi:hypothetical protein
MLAFLSANVGSIEQLEILRVLGEGRDREWDLRTLAGEVQTGPQAVKSHVGALHARGLLTVSASPVTSCRHGARTPELAAMVERLLRLYRERPVTMIRMLYQQGNRLR